MPVHVCSLRGKTQGKKITEILLLAKLNTYKSDGNINIHLDCDDRTVREKMFREILV